MTRYNYAIRTLKFNTITYRLFLIADSATENYVEVDPDTLSQQGDEIFAIVSSSGGVPNTLMTGAGGNMAQEGDMFPELSLKFISGAWYMRIGAAT